MLQYVLNDSDDQFLDFCSYGFYACLFNKFKKPFLTHQKLILACKTVRNTWSSNFLTLNNDTKENYTKKADIDFKVWERRYNFDKTLKLLISLNLISTEWI